MFRFLVLSALVACVFGNSILPTGRIVGGHDTKIEDHPHQISLRGPNGKHGCGGSILSSRKILTAAHCFEDKPNAQLTIQYGITERGTEKNVISVANVTRHPDYDTDLNNYDFCVLTLDEDIPFSASAKPIALAKEEPTAGAKAVVTGWGDRLDGRPHPKILQEVEVNIIDKEECQRLYANNRHIVDKSTVCAGVRGGGKDACQNDSGGPLVVDDILVGVVSWGVGCGEPNHPGVYSNVAEVLDWIESQ